MFKKMTVAECVICYRKRMTGKNALLCRNKTHHVCYECMDRGDMVVVSDTGWPCYKSKCPVCRQWTYAVTERVDDLHLARCLIRNLQSHLRDDSDED